MEPRNHDRENDIETAVGLPSAEGAINAGVVDLRLPIRILFNRQFLPLTSHVQQFQDVIEQDMQGELWRRAPPSNGQVGQDKLPELLEAQFRRNTPGLQAFRHLDPQKKGEPVSVQVESPKFRDSSILRVGSSW